MPDPAIEPPFDSEWIGFEMCDAPGCCMIAGHGGDHWPGDADDE